MAARICSVDGCDRKHFAKGYCHLHYSRLWRGKRREQNRQKAAGWRTNNRAKIADIKRKHRYGITADGFEGLLDAQGWRCAICSRELTKETACVDHEHSSGKIRGVLCKRCNTGIGMFADKAHALESAARYVRRNSPGGQSGSP